MSVKLFLDAMAKFCLGVVLVGVLVFLPAGTFAFLPCWIFMAVLFLPMFCAGIVMMVKSPALLARRLRAKEKEAEQRSVVALSGLMFLGGFVTAGLNFRFGWVKLPLWVSFAAAGVFLFAYVLYAEVLRENAYLSRTIEVAEGQTVVDTGLYGIVRHPMYAVTLLLFLAIPWILGSPLSFLLFLLYPFLIVKRIKNEEKVLMDELPGYREYTERVKYRLIPFLW